MLTPVDAMRYEHCKGGRIEESVMMKVTRLCRISILNLLVLALLAVPQRAPAGETTHAEDILGCHAFASAVYLCDAVGGCDRDYKLQRQRFDGAYKCARHWLDCDIYARTESPKLDLCLQRGPARCLDALQGQQTFLQVSGASQRAQVGAHCDDLDFQSEFLGPVPLGLDFSDIQSTCTSLGSPLQSVSDFTTCGDKYETRLYAKLLTLIAPRTREFLEDNLFCDLFPEEGVTPTVCNSALGPRPQVNGGVPAATVGKLRKCQNRLFRGYRQIVHSHLKFIEYCAEDHMRCEIRKTYGALSDNAYDRCIAKADNKCERFRYNRDKRIPRSVAGIKRSCGDTPFNDMVNVLGFGDIAADCGVNTVDGVIDCLPDKVKCIAWDSVRFVEARMFEDTPVEYLNDYLSCGN